MIADGSADPDAGRGRPARPGRARPRQRGAPPDARRRARRRRRSRSSAVTRTSASSASRRSTRRSPAREAYAPEHLELHVADAGRARSRASGTRAPSSSAARRCSATTPPARRTSCRPAGSRGRRAGSGSRRSSSRCRSSRPTTDGGRARRRGRRPARAGRGASAARGGGARMSVARAPRATPVADGFAPYAWAAAVDEVAERHGIPREAVLKFDQNTPPLPGVPQVPLGAEHGPAQRVPGRHVPRAPGGGRGVRRARPPRTSSSARAPTT